MPCWRCTFIPGVGNQNETFSEHCYEALDSQICQRKQTTNTLMKMPRNQRDVSGVVTTVRTTSLWGFVASGLSSWLFGTRVDMNSREVENTHASGWEIIRTNNLTLDQHIYYTLVIIYELPVHVYEKSTYIC